MNNSGFGIDPETHVPTAAKIFEESDMILSSGGATGKYAESPFTPVSVIPCPGRNAPDSEEDCVVICRLDDPFGDNIKTISVRIVVVLRIRFTYGFKT